jgi:4-amino-4-deoxy-L-arabinose transferase-like glycosyltransferase
VVVATPAARRLPAGWLRGPVATSSRGWAPEAAVLALAACLRLAALGRVPTNPYYDAAVRSMGRSWAGLLAGAFEPGRRVAIDKPPVDLWLQVASTRLLGFGAVGLLLPEALGGVALVAALMWLVRIVAGREASVVGGLALAVLPSAVVVARSDTMDAVMAALATAGVALVAHAARGGRLRGLAGAGALLGLAFEVKLTEALVAILAAAVLWLLAAPRRRRAGLAVGGATLLVTALAWLVVVTVVPLHPRPWALGGSNGSPWQATLVYNGIDRLLPHRRAAHALTPARAAALAHLPAGPGPSRLLSTRAHLRTWIGIEAVAALAALAAALALGAPRDLDRAGRAGVAALALWLVAGLALCSALPALRPRYLACVEPAVAGALGIGAVLAVRGRGAAVRVPVAAAVGAVLAVGLVASEGAVRHATQDAGRTGAMPAARVAALSAYVRARDAGTSDELAVSAPAKAGPLIARDGRPVLVLSDGQGRQLVEPRALAAAVGAGRVRFALLGDRCAPDSPTARTGCLPVVRWARAHGLDVSRAARQPRGGALYALTTSAPARAARPGRRRRAARRAARRQAAHARRRSARRSRARRARRRRAPG